MNDEIEKELSERIDEVLFYIWDPIGVNHYAQARDEYRAYVPRVLEAVRTDAGPEELIILLNQLAAGPMGLGSSEQLADRARAAVETVFDWMELLNHRAAREG
ncbi:MAG TPA: hypothetical protein VGL56_19530 [Fimbriimonadaceae bacterium]|jgi:hypothetical protein